MKTIEVKVPPMGDFHDVPVIEVLVKPGESVPADAGLVTLESEKATMDVPAPAAGTVRELRVKVGDRVSEGSTVVMLEMAEASGADGKTTAPPAAKAAPAAAPAKAAPAPAPAKAAPAPPPAPSAPAGAAPAAPAAAAPPAPVEVKVPAIGDFKDVPVIEVLVKAGDTIARDASLITLESEKATMDVPSPSPGTVREVRVKVGDKVSEGSVVVVLEPAAAPAAAESSRAPAAPAAPQGASAARAEAAAAPPRPRPPPPPRLSPASAPAPTQARSSAGSSASSASTSRGCTGAAPRGASSRTTSSGS